MGHYDECYEFDEREEQNINKMEVCINFIDGRFVYTNVSHSWMSNIMNKFEHRTKRTTVVTDADGKTVLINLDNISFIEEV